jgi:hypothetical protein
MSPEERAARFAGLELSLRQLEAGALATLRGHRAQLAAFEAARGSSARGVGAGSLQPRTRHGILLGTAVGRPAGAPHAYGDARHGPAEDPDTEAVSVDDVDADLAD